MCNGLLHHAHRLLEAVQGQLSVVLHLSQQACLHNWLRQHVQLVLLEVVLHDCLSGPLFEIPSTGRIDVSPAVFFLHQLVSFEDDSLGELFIQHVKLVRPGLFFAILFSALSAASLPSGFLRLCLGGFHKGALVFFLVLVVLFIVLLKELSNRFDSAHGQCQLGLLQRGPTHVDLSQLLQLGDVRGQLCDLSHGDTENAQFAQELHLGVQVSEPVLIEDKAS